MSIYFFLWTSSIVYVFGFLTFDIFLTIWHLFDNLTSFWHFDISFNLNDLSPSQGYFFNIKKCIKHVVKDIKRNFSCLKRSSHELNLTANVIGKKCERLNNRKHTSIRMNHGRAALSSAWISEVIRQITKEHFFFLPWKDEVFVHITWWWISRALVFFSNLKINYAKVCSLINKATAVFWEF